jgi:recombination protein RecT
VGKACWQAEWGEMAKKTVIRRLSKRLPSSNDIDQVLQSDNMNYEPITAVTVAEEAPQQIEAQVSVADLNRQIAAAAQTDAVSQSDSGEEETAKPAEAQQESVEAEIVEADDPF